MSDASQPPVVILGAGLTGLSAAHHLRRERFVLVERHHRVGGHARTHRREGHVFDVTGHWLHLRDPRIQSLVGDLFPTDAWVEVERRTKIFSHGALLEYPFQANLHGLPLEVVQECLVGFLESQVEAARGEVEHETFEAFARARFGAGIARHFFVPYNTKLWGMHPDQLTADWVSRYIPIPEPAQLIGGAIGLTQEGLGYNARFLYPRAGGIDALPEALRVGIEGGDRGQLLTGTTVDEIDITDSRVKLSTDADWRTYSRLISTIPLPELVRRIPAAPERVREAASALRWVRWRYLDLATKTPPKADYHWVYVPEMQYPFFRVGVFSNAVDTMAPPGGGSLYVELVDRDRDPDLPAIFEALVEIGAIESKEDVRFCDVRDVEYAYVVFDDAYKEATRTIHDWLADIGIRSCGRYGAWIYNSMEDSMIQGLEAAAWVEAE